LLGNVTGDLLGNVTGDVTGNLTGDVTAQVVTSDTELLVSSDAGMVKIRSGFHGLLISAYDDTTTQDQYAISITPGGAAGLTSTTNLYGDVRVVNSTTSNITGGSFRLPWYTTAERNARFVSFINYGELIYNTTDNKVQAYTSSGWVDIS
jgi:hypothetical protein